MTKTMSPLSKPRLLVLLIALILFTSTPAAGASFEEGLENFHANHVEAAQRIFAAVLADPAASQDDRARAEREIARIAWLARGDVRPMRRALEHAPHDSVSCDTAALAARIVRGTRDASAVSEMARARVADCGGSDRDNLLVQLTLTRLASATEAGDRAQAMAQAAQDLGELTDLGRLSPDAAQARLSLAILQRDGAAALAAWRDYFWLHESDCPPALSTYSGRVQTIFQAGLKANAPLADVLDLVELLTRGGFLGEARAIASDARLQQRASTDLRWRRIAALFRFVDETAKITLQVNRAFMRGRASVEIRLQIDRTLMSGRGPHEYGAIINAVEQRLMRDAGLQGDIKSALEQTFGLYGGFSTVDGYPGFMAGFITEDARVHVEQYHRSSDVRAVVLDHIISSGFETWLWDDWGGVGGWVGDDAAIVSVRVSYGAAPLLALELSRPGPARDTYVARTAQLSRPELDALAASGVATLPATSNRLGLQAFDQIAARSHGDDRAFLDEASRAERQYTLIHETRHALDRASYPGTNALTTEEAEFRARLSELALSDYPRLSLRGIGLETVGPETPSSRANARVLAAYRDWIGAHRNEIVGFDASVPALAQLDKLSDGQIREVARAADPDAH